MTIALIIICAVFCVGIVVVMVGHLGLGVASDRGWRSRIERYHEHRRARRGQPTV